MTYTQAIREARERYKEAMDDAAADALLIVEQYGKPLQTVCKDIAGEGWAAVRQQALRIRETAGESPADRIRRREADNARKDRSRAKAVLKDPEQAAKVIASLPAQAVDELYHEARLARMGEDRTPAARKAAKAVAHQAVAPLKRSVARTHEALCIQALEEATADLQELIDEDGLTTAGVNRIEAAYNEFANLLMEAKFAREVEA